MPRRVKILLTVVLSALAGVLLVGLCAEAVLPPVARWLDVGQPPECVDHVLVLPGDENTRPLVAAALVQTGLARDVLVPQTRTTIDERDGISQPTAQIIRSVLMHRGVSDDRIVLLKGTSGSTYDDVRALEGFLRERPGERMALVTSAFHSRRARMTLKRVLGERSDQVMLVSAPNPGFAASRWWRSREGFRLIVDEHVKLALYSVRYGQWIVWLMAGAVMAAVAVWAQRRRRSPRGQTAVIG